MRIDLHSHSDRSDGTLSPRALVEHARAERIDVLALTDHDSVAGWEEASRAATRHGPTLVRGLEISCRFSGHGVHLLAYLPDPADEPLAVELRRIVEGREARLPLILARLRAVGIDLDVGRVRALSGGTAATGRPHVADALVHAGVVASRTEAFDRYLGPQGPAHVDRYAPALEEMVATVARAGGVTVLAHPWARHDHSALDEAGLANLREAGLAGVEVDHEDHPRAAREALRAIAGNLGLLVTGSSDFHGSGKVGHRLGCNTTDPDVYEQLVTLARASAAASGRRTPGLVGGRPGGGPLR